MYPSDQIIDFIKQWEGFSPKPYRNFPHEPLTIGYGFTTLYGDPVKWGEVLSLEDAGNLLHEILMEQYSKILSPVPKNTPQNKFDALVSLAYNIGPFRLKESKTWRMFQDGLDIGPRFKLWSKANGVVVKGLLNRRLAEQRVYEFGDYDLDQKAS